MAVRNLDIRDASESGDLLDVWRSPVFFGFDDAGDSGDWAIVGKYAVLGILTSTGDGHDALTVNVGHAVAIADEGDSGDGLSLVLPVVPQALLAIADEGESDDALSLGGTFGLAIADVGESGDALNVGQALLPLLRDPLPGEVAGAVNVVPNPSLETNTVGWSTTAGATLDRDDADPWAGDWEGLATIVAGAGAPEVLVRSVANLRGEGQRRWVGSVTVRGDALDVRPFLRFHYADGSNDLGTGALWEPAVLGGDLRAFFDGLSLSGLAEGDPIPQWDDEGPNGWHAVQNGADPVPTYDAAHPGAHFELNLDNVLAVPNLSASEIDETVFLVVRRYSKIATNPNAGVRAMVSSGTAGGRQIYFTQNDLDVKIARAAGGIIGESVTDVGTTITHLIRAQTTAATWEIGVDGELAPTSGVHALTYDPDEITWIGRGSVAIDTLTGTIRGLLFAADLPVEEYQKAEGFLAHRYGIAANLPATHPYKTLVPLIALGAPATADPVRVATAVATPDPAKVVDRIDLVVAVPQTGGVQTLRLDGAMIEEASGGGASGYVDGDQGAGYAWFGPEHASVSYREPMLA